MACSQEDMDNVQSIVQQVTIEARLSSQEASQPTVSQPEPVLEPVAVQNDPIVDQSE